MLGDSVLPYGYTRVDYLQSNGQQVINTGFVSTSGVHDVECRFSTVNASTNGVTLFGARTNSGVTPAPARFGNLYWGGVNTPGVWIGSTGGVIITSMPVLQHEIHVVRLLVDDGAGTVRRILTKESTQQTVDDTVSFAGITTTIDTVHLFGAMNSGSIVERIAARVYGFKMWEDGVLVRDFIPALDATNTPCMWCTVTKKAYYRIGSTDFTYGLL